MTEDFSVSGAQNERGAAAIEGSQTLEQVLVVVEEVDENLYLGARNIRQVDVTDVQGVNPVNLIGLREGAVHRGRLETKAEEMLG